jgi:hypothetical protein
LKDVLAVLNNRPCGVRLSGVDASLDWTILYLHLVLLLWGALWPNKSQVSGHSTGLPTPIRAIGFGFFGHFAQSASVPPAAVQKWQKPLAAAPSFPFASLAR